MKLVESFKIAFSMYSAIPTPYADWKEENLRYALCFFPLVGVPIALVLFGWWVLTDWLNVGVILRAAVSAAIPLWVTGGIHLDGFCDTVDARSSHQDRERKLEILKDPHTGAFAVMGSILYLLLSFALWTELYFDWKSLGVLAVGFIVSRSLSGLSVVCFRPAKKGGTLAAFSNASQRKIVAMVMLFLIFLSMIAMLFLDWRTALPTLSGAAVAFVYYWVSAYRQFGGVTGDLAGHFLQLCELLMLVGTVAAQKWMSL